ncbi:MAG: hypothetical protein IIA44_15235, partial [Acidobacteria bacterium]|nr:hypothetical protein [Acidobacteriota bacterium]
MDRPPPKRRLDEILLAEGLATEEDIREALLRQKEHGGKFGSHLLYHRSIAEADLVRALAMQLGCKGVILSEKAIEARVVEMMPRKIRLARKVIPFDFDPASNVRKVACEDPTDQTLVRGLGFVTRGRTVKLYVAAELALNTTIAKYDVGRDVSLNDNRLLEIPDHPTATGGPVDTTVPKGEGHLAKIHPTVLLVTDDESATSHLQSLLECDNYRVVVSGSADAALSQLDEQRFHAVFIKDSVAGDYLHLVDRARSVSPKTMIRFYGSASSLIMNRNAPAIEAELVLANLELFTSLLASKDGRPENHGGRVGRYANRLCRRLDLPDKDRLQISNAGYVHDLARYYYTHETTKDHRAAIRLTIQLLRSVNYSPVALEMLRTMYADLNQRSRHRLPIEVLGGNILTIADVFCDSASAGERLSLDRFDGIKKKLRGLTGTMFLPEVAEAFIAMIQEEMLDARTGGRLGQVMIYAVDPTVRRPLELRLQNEGFRTVSEGAMTALLDLYRRSEPDILLLSVAGAAGGGSGVVMGVYQGDSLDGLTQVVCGEPRFPSTTVGFEAAAGETYFLQVAGVLRKRTSSQVAGAGEVATFGSGGNVVFRITSREIPSCPAPELSIEDRTDDVRIFLTPPEPGRRHDILSTGVSMTNEHVCLRFDFAAPVDP